MQTRSKRERTLLILAGVFVPLILIWNFLAPSGKSGPKAALLSLADAQHKTDVAKYTYRKLVNDQEAEAPRVGQMAYDKPAEQLIPLIIRDLQARATQAGVHLREIRPLRARIVANGTAARVPLEVRFRAAFQPAVVKFLYLVEDPTGKMVVNRMNIVSADARFKTVDVSAQVAVFTRSTVGAGNGSEGENTDVAPTANAK